MVLVLGTFLFSFMIFSPKGSKEKIFFDAVVLMEQEFYEQAIPRLDSVLILDSVHSKAYLMRGVCYQNLDKDSIALGDFNQAKNLEPEDPEVVYFLAEAYQKTYQWDSALKYYSLTASLDGGSIKSQRGILRSNGKMNKWNECAKTLDILENQGFRGPEMQYYRGMISLKSSDTASAKRAFNSGWKMDKSYGPCGLSLGEIHYGSGNFDSSLIALSEVNQNSLEDPSRYHLLKAKNHLGKGDTLMALIGLNESIHLDPDQGEAYYYRAPVKIYFQDSAGACDDINNAFLGEFSSDSSLFFLYNCGNN